MKSLFRTPLMKWFKRLIRNPKYRWLVILGSLVYLVSPLDISPDVFPVIGWIDDGLLASIVVTELTQMAIDYRRKKVDKFGQTVAATDSENIIDIESVTVG
ncbi:MAG: YkvA family protein [Cyanobacteria bacterium P01_E01_bin.43]